VNVDNRQVAMKKAVRIYEMARGKADNIAVVDKLMLVVHRIDERTTKVWFVANPNTVEYRETAKSQSVGYEAIDDARFFWVAPKSDPVRVEIEGTTFEIALESIGTEGARGERRWTRANASKLGRRVNGGDRRGPNWR